MSFQERIDAHDEKARLNEEYKASKAAYKEARAAAGKSDAPKAVVAVLAAVLLFALGMYVGYLLKGAIG